jgi:hypothetical protein
LFLDKFLGLKKILFLMLLIMISSSYNSYASDDTKEKEQTRNDKKRQRPEDEVSAAETSLHSTSAFISDNDKALEETPAKKPRLSFQPSPYLGGPEGDLSSQALLSFNHVATAPSTSTGPSPGDQQDTRSLLPHVPSSSSISNVEELFKGEQTEQPFKESRITTKKLAYFYKDKYFDFTVWEDQSAKLIRKITEEIHKTTSLKTINLALAQLSFIYEENAEIYKVDYILPYFFMSRWPDEREKTIIHNAFLTAKREVMAPGQSEQSYNHFHVGNGKEFRWQGFYPQFKQHLKSIICATEGDGSSLIKERITRREQQINIPTVKDFSLWYFHSEQAIIIYLMHEADEYLPNILRQIRKEATVIDLLLNIVSYNDMCERCGDTFFRASEKNSFTSIMKAALEKEDYKVSPNGIRFFVACTGLEKYPSDDGTILRDQHDQAICSVSYADKDGIDLLNYKHPTVPQHYLTEEGI